MLRIVSVGNASHGAVSMDADGAIRFVPQQDYFGDASFTYTVADGAGGFTVGTASLRIAPVNDAPRLIGEAVRLDEDTVATFSATALLTNDGDVDDPHAALRIVSVGAATHGSVAMIDGAVLFTPDANFNGRAGFTYTVADGSGGTSEATVTLEFAPVNDAPVANDELLWGKRDVAYTLTQAALLANDLDVESPGDLRISSIGNVRHGQATLQADGSVTFVPDAGYAGRGSFTYVVQDPEGATSTATAQIDFSRVNVNPTATDDSFIGYEDIALTLTSAQLLVNDLEPAMNQGNVVFGTSTVRWADGHVSTAADVMFAGEGIALPAEIDTLFPASRQEAELAAVERLARLFNQAVNTASVASDDAALAYVPPGAGSDIEPEDMASQLSALLRDASTREPMASAQSPA